MGISGSMIPSMQAVAAKEEASTTSIFSPSGQEQSAPASPMEHAVPFGWDRQWDDHWKAAFWVTPAGVAQRDAPTTAQRQAAAPSAAAYEARDKAAEAASLQHGKGAHVAGDPGKGPGNMDTQAQTHQEGL